MTLDLSHVTFGENVYSGVGTSVFKGSYQQNDVAIKVLTLSAALPLSTVINEVNMQMRLNHRNICKVFGYAVAENQSYILVEWMDRDLIKVIGERVGQRRPWSASELWSYFFQLIDAFAYAQESGISHRDIKPANIFLNSNNDLKIGDFGTAKQMTSDSTVTMVGSPYYLSPEMKAKFLRVIRRCDENTQYNPFRSDVYSLGLTFLHMILMRPSLQLTELDKLKDSTPNELANVPEEFRLLLSEMLRWDYRMDFLELQNWLTPLQANIEGKYCMQCRNFTLLKIPSRLADGMEPQWLCSVQCRFNYYFCYQQAVHNGVLLRIDIV